MGQNQFKPDQNCIDPFHSLTVNLGSGSEDWQKGWSVQVQVQQKIA